MILNVHASRIQITELSKDYVDRRIEFALGRFRESISSVTVTLEDTNGPRGGIDQRCQIRVNLMGHRRPVIVESTQDVLRAAIDVAASTAFRAVSRQLDRQLGKRRVPSEAEVFAQAEAQAFALAEAD